MDADALRVKQKNLIVTNMELAKEIEKIVPKVAYYCRLYGVEQALSLGQKDMNPVIKQVILDEFQALENLKIQVGITKESRDEDAAECLAFAKSIFMRAMKMDRSDLPQYVPAAALSFKKAVKFFQVATQFGDLPEDCFKAKNYAATRCIDLAKAHKAGETPPPAPVQPFGDKELMDDETAALMAELNSLPDTPTGITTAPHYTAPAAAAPPSSPPPQAPLPRPPSSLPPDAVPAIPPPRRFNIGQQVKYCPDGTVNCIKEDAIVQNETTAHNGQPAYRIYLTKRRQELTVPGELLAPALETGDKIVFYPDDGQGPEEVEIEEIYGSRWPPTYLIKRPGRGLVEAEDERLLLVKPVPAAAAATPVQGSAGGANRADAGESSSAMDPVAELTALKAVAAALAAAEAEAASEDEGIENIYKEDLSTIGEETEAGTEEHDEEEAGKKLSTSSSVEAAKIVEHVVAAEKENEQAPAPRAAAPPAPTPPPPVVAYSAPYVAPTAPPQPPRAPPVVAAPVPAPARTPPGVVAPVPTPYHVVSAPASPPAAAAAAGPASYALPIDPNYTPPLEALMEAQKVTKSAGSAMAFEDVPTAVKMLQDALHLLTNPGARTSSMKKR